MLFLDLVPKVVEEDAVALRVGRALGLLEVPPHELEHLFELVLLAVLVVVLVYELQGLLAAVVLVQQLGVGVAHEAVSLAGDEIAGDLDVLHLLQQLQLLEIQLLPERRLQQANSWLQEKLGDA